ncbi:glycerophosphodiester phosphodiesterase family protein [Pedobacter sp. 22226]|uniref:glycerophosphodiester phosphodiesterase family protein n=1 Tax=Pedobacter sp. 22226 TaxID=3453894 RepID=UPI003F84A649
MKSIKYYSLILICPVFLLLAFKIQPSACPKPGQTLQDYFKWRAGRKMPLIMAHRMSPETGYPDNGLKTLKFTHQLAPCVIQEMDVRMTKDSALVMLHDATLDRTTTGKDSLNKFTLKEIAQYQLKDINGTLIKGERIPKLMDVLHFVKKNKMIVALDMKPGTDPKKLMAEVISLQTLNQVIIICYTIKDAQLLNKKYPTLMMALGFNSWENIKAIEQSGLPFKNLIALTPAQLQEKSFYDKIHSMGIMVSFGAQGGVDVYPNNTRKAYQNVFARGGDIICTDSLSNVFKAFR